jgi:hypothetical protein
VSLLLRRSGEERRYDQRVACDPDDVERLDGVEVIVDNPEETPDGDA